MANKGEVSTASFTRRQFLWMIGGGVAAIGLSGYETAFVGKWHMSHDDDRP